VWRILKWTGLIGLSLFSSALAGWFLLRGLPTSILGFLFAAGAGGMLYLTVTDLLPEAEERHYQQSTAFALAGGFMTIFVLGQFFREKQPQSNRGPNAHGADLGRLPRTLR
jgi:zinc transporter, ZIP family